MHLAGLHIYPVKSLGGMTVGSARLGPRGLDGDRRWMVVDPDGGFLTQRELPALGQIGARLDGEVLELAAPTSLRWPTTRLPAQLAEGRRRAVTVWKDRCEAIVSVEGSAFLSSLVARPVELVYMPDEVARPVHHDRGGLVSFADGFPLLLVGQGSLDELNRRLGAPIPMSRFRPNLVVAGAPAHAEDGWGTVHVGGIRMRVATPCARCSITTVDDGRPGKEPLTTLSTYRRGEHLGYDPGGVYFGMNLIHDQRGMLTVGDEVQAG